MRGKHLTVVPPAMLPSWWPLSFVVVSIFTERLELYKSLLAEKNDTSPVDMVWVSVNVDAHLTLTISVVVSAVVSLMMTMEKEKMMTCRLEDLPKSRSFIFSCHSEYTEVMMISPVDMVWVSVLAHVTLIMGCFAVSISAFVSLGVSSAMMVSSFLMR